MDFHFCDIFTDRPVSPICRVLVSLAHINGNLRKYELLQDRNGGNQAVSCSYQAFSGIGLIVFETTLESHLNILMAKFRDAVT